MSKYDELVEQFILEQFRKSGRYNPVLHGPVEDLLIVDADANWECGCWSEWTREDTFY